jgi:hypothetical protein
MRSLVTVPRVLLVLFVLLALAGCGVREAARPANGPQGYERVELRDIAPLDIVDKNVEVEGQLGPMAVSTRCGGQLEIPLMGRTTTPAAANGRPSITVLGVSSVTLSIPRARYAEVRDLPPMETVRVRGYVSHYLMEGCAVHNDLRRFVWVDSIERAAPEFQPGPRVSSAIPPAAPTPDAPAAGDPRNDSPTAARLMKEVSEWEKTATIGPAQPGHGLGGSEVSVDGRPVWPPQGPGCAELVACCNGFRGDQVADKAMGLACQLSVTKEADCPRALGTVRAIVREKGATPPAACTR